MDEPASHDPLPRFERAFLAAAPLVVVLGVLAEFAAARDPGLSWPPFFSLSYEQNLPTWYASAALLLVARALADVLGRLSPTRTPRALRLGFHVLALGFVYLSLDEAAELHEHAASLYVGHGALYFGWVVPASILVAGLGLAFVPFLRALPAEPRRAFLIAGGVYVLGAVGMELPLGAYTEQYGDQNLGYGLLDAVEESLELLGIALFLVALRRQAPALARLGDT